MKTIVALLLMAASLNVYSVETVRGYVRKDGTYVQQHLRSSPNNFKFDNYSSQGNSNPYTGQRGYTPHEYPPPPVYNPQPYSPMPYGSNYGYPYGQ